MLWSSKNILFCPEHDIVVIKKSKTNCTMVIYFNFFSSGEMALCNTPVEFICKTPNPSPDYYVPGNEAELESYCSYVSVIPFWFNSKLLF